MSGPEQPVAWQEAAEPFFRLAREVINPVNGERPWHADSKDWMVVFSFAGQSVTLGDLRRAAYASPIREPEISKASIMAVLDEKIFLRALSKPEMGDGFSEGYGVFGLEEAADAILNLAPVGGRGEEGSSQSQPVLSPKRDNQWLVWSGDDQPVEDGVLVDVRFNRRCGGYGKEANGYPADFWDWSHDGTADPVIIEWRISPPEISAADGASSRHTGQLRDEQNPSTNEESQTNGS